MKNDRKVIKPSPKWLIEHDCFLIENSHLNLQTLQEALPYSAEEISDRQEVLGLIRRRRQMSRLRSDQPS